MAPSNVTGTLLVKGAPFRSNGEGSQDIPEIPAGSKHVLELFRNHLVMDESFVVVSWAAVHFVTGSKDRVTGDLDMVVLNPSARGLHRVSLRLNC